MKEKVPGDGVTGTTGEGGKELGAVYAPIRHPPEPCVYIFFGLILGQAIAFLNLPLELVLPPIDDIEIVIGELAPGQDGPRNQKRRLPSCSS